jgi:hypothetical protein
MHVEKRTSAAIVVSHHWANLVGVRAFLRQKDDPHREIRAQDDSHVILAKIVDSEDPVGLWIEIEWRKQDGNLEKRTFLIPWREVLTIVIGACVEEESRTIGF